MSAELTRTSRRLGPVAQPHGWTAQVTGVRWGDWAVCGGLVVLAALFRVVLLSTAFAHVDSDQAVLGLMAFHIQAGDRPVFYYGQPYMGSLEAYLAAAFFTLWGATEWSVRLPALCFSLAFVGEVYWLGKILYGRWIGLLAGIFVACGPAVLINWSTAAGAGYIEAMVCGTLLLVLAVLYPDLRALPPLAALAAGLLAGIGVWMEPMIGEYLVPVGVAWTLRLLVTLRQDSAAWWRLARSVGLGILGTLVGAAPLLVYNLHHGGATLTYLTSHSGGGEPTAVAGRFVTETLPILLGLVTPTTVHSVFIRLIAVQPLYYLAGLLAGAAILVRLLGDPRGLPLRIASLIVAGRAAGEGDDVPRDGVLALFAAGCLIFFVFTRYGAIPWATHLPRYLIPLYTVTPLVLAVFIPRHPPRLDRFVAAAAGGILMVTGFTVSLAAQPRAPIGDLLTLLQKHGVAVAYTNYWVAERISFETHERVHGIAVTDRLGLAVNRVPAYLDAAARAPARSIAWVFDVNSRAEHAFQRLLRRHQAHATRLRWTNQRIYLDLSRPLHAPAGP